MTALFEIPFSYAYDEFITEDERIELLDWALSQRDKCRENGKGRFFNTLDNLTNIPDLVEKIRHRIIGHESNLVLNKDPFFGTFLSFNEESASIHPHTDPNLDGHIHTRYNLIIQSPNGGGEPIYNGVCFPIHDRMLWKCEAGKYTHETTPVVGPKQRINISYGFQIPFETVSSQ